MLTERSARIVAAHRLLRRSRRTEVGEFLAEGAPAVTEAIAYAKDHPGEVLELYITELIMSELEDPATASTVDRGAV